MAKCKYDVVIMHKDLQDGGALNSHLYSKRSEFECYLKSVFRCRDWSNLETKHIVGLAKALFLRPCYNQIVSNHFI